jgi:hypothetical protein
MSEPVTPEKEAEEEETPSVELPVPAEVSEEEEAEHEHEQEQTDPEASAPKSEAEIEKASKLLVKEATAHANRISKILGEDAQDLIPCERCWPLTPGFHWSLDAAPVDDAQREAVLASVGLGSGAERQLLPAKGVRECDTCNGWGKLAYPGKVDHTKEQNCPVCIGTGYVSVPEQATNGAGTTSNTIQFTPIPASDIAACPHCGQAGMQGQPHWCVPVVSAGG